MGVVCLLKDHNTAITDGEIVYINQSGNAGMATAGMGDVLAGIIGALIARVDKNAENDVLLRAAAGAYLHGRAGDLSARKFGQYSLNSSDLLSEIPTVIAEIFVKI
jgi:NAD(P)H-hydrate epimerase